MDKILTDNAASGQPLTAATSMVLLQGAYSLTITGLAKTLIGRAYSDSVAYILNGIVGSPIVGATQYTEGLVLFNGEVFYSPAQSVADFSIPNVVIANLNITYAAVDPILFADSSTHNVHQYRRIDLASGTSGSGTIADYSDMIRVLQPSYNTNTSSSLQAAAPTIRFSENRTYTYDSLGATPTITLDATNAISDCVVTLFTSTAVAGNVIAFAGSLSSVVITGDSSLTMAENTSCYIRMKLQFNTTPIVFIEIFNPVP